MLYVSMLHSLRRANVHTVCTLQMSGMQCYSHAHTHLRYLFEPWLPIPTLYPPLSATP